MDNESKIFVWGIISLGILSLMAPDKKRRKKAPSKAMVVVRDYGNPISKNTPDAIPFIQDVLGLEIERPRKRPNQSIALKRYKGGRVTVSIPKDIDPSTSTSQRILWHEIGHYVDEARVIGGRGQSTSRIQYGQFSTKNLGLLHKYEDILLKHRIAPDISFRVGERHFNNIDELEADPDVPEKTKISLRMKLQSQLSKLKMYYRQPIELFADGFSQFIVDPKRMRKEAPELAKLFTDIIKSNDELNRGALASKLRLNPVGIIKGEEPWEMTREEWVKTKGKLVSGQSVKKTEKLAKLLHKDFVKIWLREGKPVSQEALKYYPDLLSDNPDRYQAFHGAQGTKKMVNIPVPGPDDFLVKIGDLQRIEYTPTGKSRLKGKWFYHNSGDTLKGKLPGRAILAAINKTGHLVIIPTSEGYPKFTANGIIG